MDRREFLTFGTTAAASIAAAQFAAPGVAQAARSAAQASRPVTSASIFDVKEHGAAGDGVTEDTLAIQTAIDAARAAGGGIVWFPAGVYVTRTLALHGPVQLEGTGWQSTLKCAPATNAPVITTPVGQTSYYGAVRNLSVDGNRSANSSAAAHGIRLWGADHYRIEGVRVSNCGGAAIKGDGDASHFTIAPYITSCYLDTCAGSGLDINTCTYDVKADHVDIGRCDKGVVIPGSSFLHDVSVWQCNVGVYGFWAASSHLVSCRVERSRYHGFWFEGCTDLIVEACRSYENNQSQGPYDGFALTGTPEHPTRRVSLVGCHSGRPGSAEERQRYGFSDAGGAVADHIVCSGCVAQGNLTGGYAFSANPTNAIGLNV